MKLKCQCGTRRFLPTCRCVVLLTKGVLPVVARIETPGYAGLVDVCTCYDVEWDEVEVDSVNEIWTHSRCGGLFDSSRGSRPLGTKWTRPLQVSVPTVASTGRNELCPCKSGKKYKKCCGK